MQMTGSEAIVRCLERAGVEVVLGMCGHANVSMLDALADSSIRFISVRHEQNAGHMADAYFRISGKPAVVMTTDGPGVGNAVTGIWEAAMNNSAVIVISGNVPSYMIGRGAFQELTAHGDGAQYEIYRPIVKRAWQIRALESVPYVMQRAFNLALAGRPGPVLVDVPIDFFSAAMAFEIPEMEKHRAARTRIRGDATQIQKAVELLLAAQQPLIHAGNGVSLSGAAAELAALAEHLGIPVTTSLTAHGVIDTLHPLYGGYPGLTGTPTGNALAQKADVVLALGTGFCEMETSSWDPAFSFRFGVGAKLIQVDIDPHEIGRAYPVDVGIIGDVQAVLTEILVAVQSLTPPRPWQERKQVGEMQRMAATWRAERNRLAASDEVPLRMERFIKEMAEILPMDTILVTDVGAFRHAVIQDLPVRSAKSWFFPAGLCTMGAGAPAALGAKLAAPNRPVVAFVGDGGFSANNSAVATAMEAGLPVIWVVVNNFAYDAIRSYQLRYFDNRILGTVFQTPEGKPFNPDFVKLADSYGVPGLRVQRPEEIKPALRKALAGKTPFVIELMTASSSVKAGGRWDVNDLLSREGQFKRQRDQERRAESAD